MYILAFKENADYPQNISGDPEDFIEAEKVVASDEIDCSNTELLKYLELYITETRRIFASATAGLAGGEDEDRRREEVKLRFLAAQEEQLHHLRRQIENTGELGHKIRQNTAHSADLVELIA